MFSSHWQLPSIGATLVFLYHKVGLVKARYSHRCLEGSAETLASFSQQQHTTCRYFCKTLKTYLYISIRFPSEMNSGRKTTFIPFHTNDDYAGKLLINKHLFLHSVLHNTML